MNPLSDKDVSRDQSEIMDFQVDPSKEHDVVTESLNYPPVNVGSGGESTPGGASNKNQPNVVFTKLQGANLSIKG